MSVLVVRDNARVRLADGQRQHGEDYRVSDGTGIDVLAHRLDGFVLTWEHDGIGFVVVAWPAAWRRVMVERHFEGGGPYE